MSFARNQHIKAVLRLRFNDADGEQYGGMQEADAKRIVGFVRAWQDRVGLIIVHCEAGVSRSAGVAAALMLWLSGSNADVFYNPKYCPNMLCYRQILNCCKRRIQP